jgi:dTDP-4-dehydrorhamnose reductase
MPPSPADLASPRTDRPPLALWGGHECTVNRLHDRWHDQTLLNGHQDREGDLALFADIGIRALRYPALWERMAPGGGPTRDFAWTDARLPALRALGMDPILTLCHHGSGPPGTSLLDDSFASGLAAHAAAVAQRYPWVRDWTPVNEPLTTARFSALYGFWYPHTTDERLFWTALLNEIDATRLAMRAIRAVNPQARLVQTDDLGWCHATPPLQGAADFQNQRRWMGWDLLCGMVRPGHPLWERLCGQGLEARLRAVADDPCPPDILGINHYLSSERFMDHRIERHMLRSQADRNVSHHDGVPLVDVDAVRNRDEGVLGLPALLRQAWERYRLPLAVTECHNGSTREAQARWFLEVWRGSQALRAEGVDLRAVTAWALLGSYDWNRMVTRFAGHYEPGVWDVRGGTPRPTLMVPLLRALADGGELAHPALEQPGWWRGIERLLHTPESQRPRHERPLQAAGEGALLLVGDDGPLTRLAARTLELRGLPWVRCGSDLTGALAAVRPWAVLDARDREGLAGPRRREGCPHGARTSVARQCADAGVPCALFTSAFGPGLSAEGLALPGVLVARTGPVFTPWDGQARAVQLLQALEAGQPVQASAAPWHAVYGPDLVDGVLDLLLDGASGGHNFFPPEGWTEAAWARHLAEVADCDPALVREDGAADAQAPAYPGGAAVSLLPIAETTLERFVREARQARLAGEQGVRSVERREDGTRLEPASREAG